MVSAIKKFKVGDRIVGKKDGKRICVAIAEDIAIFGKLIFKKDGSSSTNLIDLFAISREYRKYSDDQLGFPYTANGYGFKLMSDPNFNPVYEQVIKKKK